MITIERIDAAIAKCENFIKGIPPDEMVPNNTDYMKWEMLLKGFRNYKESLVRIDSLLTELGV